MEVRPYEAAKIAHRETIMEGEDMRVSVLTLAEKECIPWHFHTEITDSFVCLEGPMVVETRAPPGPSMFWRPASVARCPPTWPIMFTD